jgi:ferritin-like metal-binding protein YciE
MLMADLEKQRKLGEQKVVQYLEEAHAMELAMVQTLTAHVAITPRSRYRTGLETHLRQTRGHAERIERRLQQLGEGRNPLQVGFAIAQATIGQAIATAKAPVDMIRGASGAEKLLKNAKDEAVSEQLEVVTYVALQRLAEAVGDQQTARLAISIRQEEEQMQTALHEQVRVLTEAVVNEEVRSQKVFDLTTVGAADQVRRLAGRAGDEVERGAEELESAGRSAARRTSRTVKVARAGAKRAATTASRGARDTARGARSTATTASRSARRTARTAAGSTRRAAGKAG